MINKALYNTQNKIRNGWWIALFILFIAITSVIYTPISKSLQSIGIDTDWLGPLSVGFIVLSTWICLKLRGESFKQVGLHINKVWLKQFIAGFIVSALLLTLSTAIIMLFGGVKLSFHPSFSIGWILIGLYPVLFTAVHEELLFRGFIFQRLINGIGAFWSQLILAVLFAFGHWDNPGMEGASFLIASADLFVGALLLGLAYIKTKSLALPIGLHFGWNWFQGYILGFNVSGIESTSLFTPELNSQSVWLTGGQFGLEASIVTLILDTFLLLALWRWKNSTSNEKPMTNKYEPSSTLKTANELL